VRYIASLLGLLAVAATANAATITSEWPDYAPGETVLLTGTGWDAGETVLISLHEDPAMCPDHGYTAIADDAGNISNAEFVTDEHDIGVTFTVTATGLGSGLSAEATFTDSCSAGQVRDETCELTDLPNCTIGCRWITGPSIGRCSTLSAPVVRGTLCREATDLCDKADTCDGSHQFCPTDEVELEGHACRGPSGPCDFVERCDGSSKECPPDGFLGEERTCRSSAGSCDTAEKCSGTSAQCPEDTFQGQEKTCRPATGDCDAPDKCSGSSPDCPSDAVKPEGTTCRVVNRRSYGSEDRQTSSYASLPKAVTVRTWGHQSG